ncbi:PREDICTED: kinesin-like protein KIF18A [Priapulus caudatus]|uniref:Kinesin-like protein KIF18A n=1 Tax=Priapulus caudatus TaxID=37621 RepID=A0ABM1EAL2_PRICU|nr:PREDICTED: kinesin-like protein KIF18A [Priapulus caudatus]XP_014669235.1 PREDICTED: kinesin-like protein KIF18A [Priapulus caudatus]XP_014669236.1 PREDICTED: kinesin-like protein KIF18A [Priapulus caudatus]
MALHPKSRRSPKRSPNHRRSPRRDGPRRCDTAPAVPAPSSNVRVVLRVRPENSQENAGGYRNVVEVLDDHVLVFDPKVEQSPGFFQGKKLRRDVRFRRNKDMKFAFDHVFDKMATNEDVFENTTKSILDSLLDGYNCSVFAYGATGAGKTHTMLGNSTNPGIIFRTVIELYRRKEEMKDKMTCDIAVSYCEVYNETIKDLLVVGGALAVREDAKQGVVVVGLSLHQPKSATELLQMLEFGNKNRSQHPTDANAESSRSHAVFQVFVKQRERTANISADVRVAKMSLIDLAGSERAIVTTNNGQRFREGANINRSLLALGNCINALADSKVKGQHIPYRNSKLTRLLKDSLGGNCRTLMIAAVSPSSMTFEDTYNTLKYADRAKHIKAQLKRNVHNVNFHITHYTKIIEQLRAEVTELKSKLTACEECGPRPVDGAPVTEGNTVAALEEIKRLQGILASVFTDRIKLRKQLLDCESVDRDLQYRLHKRKTQLHRYSLIATSPNKITQLNEKLALFEDVTAAKRQKLSAVMDESTRALGENGEWLARVEQELTQINDDGEIPEVLDRGLRARQLELELRDSRQSVRFLKRFIKARERESQQQERLVASLLGYTKHQFMILKGNGLVASDLEMTFERIQEEVVSSQQIAWADQPCKTTDDGSILDIASLIDLPLVPSSSLHTPKSRQSSTRRRVTVAPTPPGGSPVVAAINTQQTHDSALTLSDRGDVATPGAAELNVNSHEGATCRAGITPVAHGQTDASHTSHAHTGCPPAQQTTAAPYIHIPAAGDDDSSTITTKPAVKPSPNLHTPRRIKLEDASHSDAFTPRKLTIYGSQNKDKWQPSPALGTPRRVPLLREQTAAVAVCVSADRPDEAAAACGQRIVVSDRSTLCGERSSSSLTADGTADVVSVSPSQAAMPVCEELSPVRRLNETFEQVASAELTASDAADVDLPEPVITAGRRVATCESVATCNETVIESRSIPINNGTVTKSHPIPINNGTVTKSRPAAVSNGTVTKSKPAVAGGDGSIVVTDPVVMNSGTVTKERPAAAADVDPASGGREARPKVVRSMTFQDDESSCAWGSPAGPRTFAEVVSSPLQPVSSPLQPVRRGSDQNFNNRVATSSSQVPDNSADRRVTFASLPASNQPGAWRSGGASKSLKMTHSSSHLTGFNRASSLIPSKIPATKHLRTATGPQHFTRSPLSEHNHRQPSSAKKASVHDNDKPGYMSRTTSFSFKVRNGQSSKENNPFTPLGMSKAISSSNLALNEKLKRKGLSRSKSISSLRHAVKSTFAR